MPHGDDDWDDGGFINNSTDSPLETEFFFCHVDFPFWEYVQPLSLGHDVLDHKIDGFLINSSTSYDRNTFAEHKKVGVKSFGEANIMSSQSPPHFSSGAECWPIKTCPQTRIIKTGMMVRNCQKRNVWWPLQSPMKVVHIVNLGFIEPSDEYFGKDAHCCNCDWAGDIPKEHWSPQSRKYPVYWGTNLWFPHYVLGKAKTGGAIRTLPWQQ